MSFEAKMASIVPDAIRANYICPYLSPDSEHFLTKLSWRIRSYRLKVRKSKYNAEALYDKRG